MSENTNATDHPGKHAQLYQHETTTHSAPALQQLYDSMQAGPRPLGVPIDDRRAYHY
jgi:hypothetical protein